MKASGVRFYRFGEFELDARRRVLTKNGGLVDISAKNFDLLSALIENEGKLLTHDQLLDIVWAGTFVEQSSLKKGISTLRHILDESPDEGRFIKTIPRQGYSFVADVTRVESPAIAAIRQTQTEIIVEETEELIDDDAETGRRLIGPVSSGRRWIVLAVGLGILLIAVLGISRFYTGGTRAQFSVERVRQEKLTNDGNCPGAISQDGNYVACMMRSGTTGVAIEIKQLATGSRRRLIEYTDAHLYALAFSPDGNFVYYVLDDTEEPDRTGLHKISVFGGDDRKLSDRVGSVTVARDGRIAYTRAGTNVVEVVVGGPNGESPAVVASLPSEIRLWDFNFTPDGGSLLCSIRKQISDLKNIFYVSEFTITGGVEKQIVPDRETLIVSAVWLPDKSSLLMAIREPNADIKQIWQYTPSTGQYVRVTNDNNSYKNISILPDGRSLVALMESAKASIWISDDEGLNFHELESGPQHVERVFWLPDGRIGYSTTENSSELVRAVSLDGRSNTRLTEGTDGLWIQPSMSGDGKAVVFNSTRSGLIQLWRVGIDGKGLTQLTSAPTPIFNGVQLSDGTVIYKTQTPESGWILSKRGPDGNSTRFNADSPDLWAVSPDETQIAFYVNDADMKKRRISIYSMTTGALILTLFPELIAVRRISWTRDGKAISFDTVENGSGEIAIQPIDGTKVKKLTSFRSESLFYHDWSFDGKKIAVVRGKVFSDTVMIKTAATN
ncbi:MAG: winged helix-turn-helix domain-containing protein [Acidobacteria bacterium]|nr:winged helix-turn-helix domain-containing protein [Acidobacteriota bacterium]